VSLSVVLPLPPHTGGARMVVFGGVGLGAIFGDTHSLRVGEGGRGGGGSEVVVWEETHISGEGPCAR
jgi:hypothetical protein